LAVFGRTSRCSLDRLPSACIQPSQRPVSCLSTLSHVACPSQRTHQITRGDVQIITKHGSLAAAARSVLFGAIRSFISQSSVALLNYSPCGRRHASQTRTRRPWKVVTPETASNWRRWWRKESENAWRT